MIKIVSESSIAAGIRRIEAITGEDAENAIDTMSDTLQRHAASMLHNAPDLLAALKQSNRRRTQNLRRQAEEHFKERIAAAHCETLIDNAEVINGIEARDT